MNKKEMTTGIFGRRKIQKIFHLILLLGMFAFTACSDNNPDPKPAPESSYTLKFKLSNVVESTERGKEVQDIPLPAISSNFGKRVELASPKELCFRNDSLFIIKSNQITEGYKAKWQNNELYLYEPSSDVWLSFGKKNNEGLFLFTIGFYMKKTTNHHRSLTEFGQGFWLKSYTDLPDYDTGKESLSLTWLTMQYLFEFE